MVVYFIIVSVCRGQEFMQQQQQQYEFLLSENIHC